MSKPALFLSKIIDGVGGMSMCQVFKGGPNDNDASNPLFWETIFVGTRQECELFTANMHHAIDPNMADKFNPMQDVKRKIEL